MDKTIRVLVANHPRLMRDLVVSTIVDQPDIQVLGEVEHETEIRGAVERMHPDCLIIALENPDCRPAICDALLRDYPEMRILAVSAEHNSSMFFWATLNIYEHRVEASEQGVLSALRSGGSGGAGSGASKGVTP